MSHFVGLSSTNAPTAGAGHVTLTTVKRRQGHWQKIAKDLRLRAAADMAESSGYTDRAAVELDAIESEQAEVTSLLQVMSDKLKRCNDKYYSLQQGLTAQRPALTDLSEQEEAMSRALATMAFNVMCDHPEAAADMFRLLGPEWDKRIEDIVSRTNIQPSQTSFGQVPEYKQALGDLSVLKTRIADLERAAELTNELRKVDAAKLLEANTRRSRVEQRLDRAINELSMREREYTDNISAIVAERNILESVNEQYVATNEKFCDLLNAMNGTWSRPREQWDQLLGQLGSGAVKADELLPSVGEVTAVGPDADPMVWAWLPPWSGDEETLRLFQTLLSYDLHQACVETSLALMQGSLRDPTPRLLLCLQTLATRLGDAVQLQKDLWRLVFDAILGKLGDAEGESLGFDVALLICQILDLVNARFPGSGVDEDALSEMRDGAAEHFDDKEAQLMTAILGGWTEDDAADLELCAPVHGGNLAYVESIETFIFIDSKHRKLRLIDHGCINWAISKYNAILFEPPNDVDKALSLDPRGRLIGALVLLETEARK